MATMTLKEYQNQENPTAGNKVVLQEGEYKLGLLSYGHPYNPLSYYRQVFINDYPYEYIVWGNEKIGGWLYTTDRHGNPRTQSTFFLPYQQLKSNENNK